MAILRPATERYPPNAISSLSIAGYRSIRRLDDLEFGKINVVIGENGTGKSSLISVFTLFQQIADGRFKEYVDRQGVDNLLYLGSSVTSQISVSASFGKNSYFARLQPSVNDDLAFAEERLEYRREDGRVRRDQINTGRRSETGLPNSQSWQREHVLTAFQSWIVYHFHNTGADAKVKRYQALNDYDRLRAQGENLAAYLYRLREGKEEDRAAFNRIERIVKIGLTYFDRFKLEPHPAREEIRLEWQQKGSDFPFTAQQLSDGSLRFILLTTALNQPVSHRPTTIVIDEPELGLHPRLMNLLAEQMKGVSQTTQIVIATQSAPLLDEFDPADVIVADRAGTESRFRRLPLGDLSRWLDEYSLSELVWKGVIGGGSSVF